MKPSFYNDFICINVLAHSLKNAIDIHHKTEGHCLIGLLASNYSTANEAEANIQAYKTAVDGAVSIGLGRGNPEQWKIVSEISANNEVVHINQVFPKVGYTYGISQNKHAWINALVHPTERLGYVNIATGPLSSGTTRIDMPVQDAITLIKEMGGSALKLFPLNGLRTKDQYQRIAEICAEEDFALEPTGGIDLGNFREIITIAKDAGVRKLIPHIYSSIIDRTTGLTNINAIEKLYTITKEVAEHR